MPDQPEILLTGATGYVGGRLLTAVLSAGCTVRCLARRPAYLQSKVPANVDVIAGDVLDRPSLDAAMRGIHTAYYLVHSMGSDHGFEEQDRMAARNFGEAALSAGVRRIVYLGGLAPEDEDLSAHLRSRIEVGEILRASGVPTVEIRASIILGSGSLSFEMIRSLVERLPIMLTPRWVQAPAQPIAITDVVAYLAAARNLDIHESIVVEIGGADRMSYEGIMREYARQRGLRRVVIRVPVLTPWLSSLWLGLVTPLYARIGRKLIGSIRHATVVRDDSAARYFAIRPMGVADAIAAAIRNEDQEMAATHWADALSASGARQSWFGTSFGHRLLDSRVIDVPAAPAAVFKAVEQIGGKTGWYYGDWLWQLRGVVDIMAGGVGMRRGRRDAMHLREGDTVDCWRVEEIVPNRRLRLFAEMKLPGRAWLEFELDPIDNGTRLRQTAIFDPIGVSGRMYWYSVYPLHQFVFAGMLKGIARAAQSGPVRGVESTERKKGS